MTEGSFEGVEGVKIFTREWQPARAAECARGFLAGPATNVRSRP